MADAPEGDDRQRFLDRCFEVHKHLATLNTAAALLILAIYREEPFKERLLALTLILVGACVVISVFGMLVISLGSRIPPHQQPSFSDETEDAITRWITTLAGGLFIASVVTFAQAVLSIPFRRGVLVELALLVVVVGVLLLRRWRHKRLSSANKPPEQGGE